ncbi:tripartite tricarboxylate transporter substrate binding protein [Paralcaligenes sp. KSB-10]|jgi:tripartite-type tricarboxylate transporter receptor subunit TctC|uniref:Bug family tripartite tricarboxylate transporter substrate binding protein n=1 Tax=Paralcaligenes sp. KSB-10 TaxID=2901142 RepID=UPI001E4116F9|nr:tripartite tricarboxylate transporter substrate binding protein [Paralcaligenes sp. KSB-10]UHL63364.1 tripartite tricarboxylate transporter substrate binding protein [Paralcaligenes sp. KSB-10]
MKNGLALFLSMLVLVCPYAAGAAAWPEKPIKLVVPYAPGGSTDVIARQYGNFLHKELKQAVIIENKPGAATNIGSEAVARADPDGYTFLWGVDTLATNPSVGPVPPFDVHKSLAAVSLIARMPGLVATNMNFPAKTISELIAMARRNPSKYTISSASLFLQVGMLEKYTDISLTHVPYKGGAQAATDAIGGQVDMVFANIPVLQTLTTSGKLRALAITSAKRSEALPDVPTLKESGMPNGVFGNWYGIFAPKNTPRDIILKMAAVSRKFVEEPTIRKTLEHNGYQLEASTPEELEAMLQEDALRTKEFVRQNPGMFANK